MIEIPCRPAEPGEIPGEAKALAALAEAHGWEVAITYARASRSIKASNGRRAYVIAKGTAVRAIPPRDAYTMTIESIAVRMWREGKLVACWINGRYDMGGSQYRGHTLTELRTMVAMNRAELAAHVEGTR